MCVAGCQPFPSVPLAARRLPSQIVIPGATKNIVNSRTIWMAATRVTSQPRVSAMVAISAAPPGMVANRLVTKPAEVTR